MSRKYRPFLDDIRLSCERILQYTKGYDYQHFLEDERTYDATLRHLAIIGEAVKQIPEDIRALNQEVEWRKIGRFRDLVIHHYFAIDNKIIWDVIENKVPVLLTQLNNIVLPPE